MGPESQYKQQLSLERDRLGITGFFSALIHVTIILGVSFSLPQSTLDDGENTIDIVLLNNPNKETPEDAEFFSQSDSQGGGTGEEIATSPLPWKAVPVEDNQEVSHTPKPPPEDANQTEAILTSEVADAANTPLADPLEEPDQPVRETGSDEIDTNDGVRSERERLIAQLNDKWQEYQKRPRRMYLSPTTRMHDAAIYMDKWRSRVEQVGNLNFPEQAKANNLTGSLILEVAINPDGSINQLRIIEPSQYKLLDDAALRFVRLAAPFETFPEEIRETTDILHITRSFHFLEDNRVISSVAAKDTSE
jgi:protein TonB